jgi:secreted PhoX family phosphatase
MTKTWEPVQLLVLGQILLAFTTLALQADPVYAWTNFVGQPGGRGNADGTGSTARFTHPQGIAVDSAGNIYVADSLNNRISKGTPIGPPALTIRSDGGSIIISWPNTGNYTLQQSGTLADPGGWATSGYTVTTTNGTSSITISEAAGTQFFRLRQ